MLGQQSTHSCRREVLFERVVFIDSTWHQAKQIIKVSSYKTLMCSDALHWESKSRDFPTNMNSKVIGCNLLYLFRNFRSEGDHITHTHKDFVNMYTQFTPTHSCMLYTHTLYSHSSISKPIQKLSRLTTTLQVTTWTHLQSGIAQIQMAGISPQVTGLRWSFVL